MEQSSQLPDNDLLDDPEQDILGDIPEDNDLQSIEIDVPIDETLELTPGKYASQLADNDVFGRFLHEAAGHSLLTHEQEIWLGIQIRAQSRFLSRLLKHGITRNSKLNDLQSFVITQLVDVHEAIPDILLACHSLSIPAPDLGSVFSDILVQRIRGQDPFPTSFFEWLSELKALRRWDDELVRKGVNFVADILCVPVNALVCLSVQFNTWESSTIDYDKILNMVLSLEQIDLRVDELNEVGRQAREDLVLSNIRLVVHIARRYASYDRIEDLTQAGTIGLIRALKTYQPEMKYRFSTYAFWWIRQAVTRHVCDHSRTIRIPVHATDMLNKLIRTRDRMIQELGRPPFPEELAAEMGFSDSKRVTDLLRFSREPLSLDMSADDGDSTIGDFVPDRSPAPDYLATQKLLSASVDRVLLDLPAREAAVLRMRYGLSGNPAMTLEEVGRRMGITRERIRQIETQALTRLRHPRIRRMLREYLS